jgi:hypothetical protein
VTLLGAVDTGYRMILSSPDEARDSLMQLYHRRHSEHIEVGSSGLTLAS